MRPHLTFHDSVATVLGYLTQTDKPGTLRPPEPIGGTIPWLGLGPTLHHAQRMPRPSRHAKNVLHVTLSLPDGMIADRPAWAEMARMAIGGLGLPPRRIPWLAFRHRDTTCDRLHMMLMAASFAGRPLALPDLQRRCDEVHVRLCRHLGLTPPRYHQAAAGPRLEVFCPLRRLRSADRRRMASDIGTALIGWQPTSLSGLQAALVASGSPVRVEEVKETDHRVITFALGKTQVPGRALSDELDRFNLLSILDHARRSRRLRGLIDRRHLLAALASADAELKDIYEGIKYDRNHRTAVAGRDEPRPMRAANARHRLPA